LKLNGTHQLLAYADDVNILAGSIHTLKENAESLVAATREIGLEISADKTKHMVMSRDQNAGRIQSLRNDNTELFISPSGISELDCATTNTDTAERSISICRESLQVLFVLGALAYLLVPPLGVVVMKNGVHSE